MAISIEKGHFGEVPLDGLKIGVVFSWPGPIHEGKGKCQPIVDSKASPQQREALLKIMSGQETEPFATMFSVFAATMETVYEPIFTRIDYNVNVDARPRASIRQVEITQRGAFGLLTLDAKDVDAPELGAATPYPSLKSALDHAVTAANINVLYGAKAESVQHEAQLRALLARRARLSASCGAFPHAPSVPCALCHRRSRGVSSQ